MRYTFTILLICFSLTPVFSQSEKTSERTIDTAAITGKFMDTGFQNEWQEFTLQDTLFGEVLAHFDNVPACGVLASATLTYVITSNQDTIRVKELCGPDTDTHKGDKVRIAPDDKPDFEVLLPFLNWDKIKNNWVPHKLDTTVKQTTWGTILDI